MASYLTSPISLLLKALKVIFYDVNHQIMPFPCWKFSGHPIALRLLVWLLHCLCDLTPSRPCSCLPSHFSLANILLPHICPGTPSSLPPQGHCADPFARKLFPQGHLILWLASVLIPSLHVTLSKDLSSPSTQCHLQSFPMTATFFLNHYIYHRLLLICFLYVCFTILFNSISLDTHNISWNIVVVL